MSPVWPLRRRERGPGGPVRVAIAMHQPEADLLVAILREAGIPAMARPVATYVPDMGMAGRREVLVPADRELEARALLDPLPDEGGG